MFDVLTVAGLGLFALLAVAGLAFDLAIPGAVFVVLWLAIGAAAKVAGDGWARVNDTHAAERAERAGRDAGPDGRGSAARPGPAHLSVADRAAVGWGRAERARGWDGGGQS